MKKQWQTVKENKRKTARIIWDGGAEVKYVESDMADAYGEQIWHEKSWPTLAVELIAELLSAKSPVKQEEKKCTSCDLFGKKDIESCGECGVKYNESKVSKENKCIYCRWADENICTYPEPCAMNADNYWEEKRFCYTCAYYYNQNSCAKCVDLNNWQEGRK